MENQNPWDTDNNSPNPHESSSTKSTSGESNSAINAKRYAALTGFAQPTNQSDESDTTEGTEEPESTLLETEESSSTNPYQERTFHSFSSHPIPKIILVFGTVLIAVLVAGAILNSGSFKQTANQEEPESVPTITSNDNDDTDSNTPELEKGELLTEIALAEQKQQLEALDSPQNRAKSTPNPSPPPYQTNSRPSPVVSPTPAPPPPKVIYRSVPVSVPPLTSVPPVTPPEPIDPQQAWIAATKIGNYGQVTGLSTQAKGKNNPHKNIDEPSNPNTSINTTPALTAPTTHIHSQQILIGSTAKAVLTNSIVWDKSSLDHQKSLFFRLEEPLNDNDGSVVIPQGAQIIASIGGVAPSGVVEVKINSVLLEKQGKWQQLPLPPDSLYIQGKKGKPLLAKSFSPNNSLDWGGGATEAIGTAARETDLPGGRNLPRVIDRLSPSSSRYWSASFYWSLKKGIEVEVLVARSFALPLASKKEKNGE